MTEKGTVMNHNLTKLFHKTTLGFLAIIIFFGMLATLPLPWNESVEDTIVDLQFKLRGDRRLSDEIILVFISAEDVKSLGGWPITRDYYGYMTHALSSLGARVIGFDLLFDTPDRRYPEYDQILAGLIQSANNVCLPMVFYELSGSDRLMMGSDPILPFQELRERSTGIGFSNFGKEKIVRKVPLAVAYGDGFMLSFGTELARLYLNCSKPVEITSNAVIMSATNGKQFSFPIDRQGRLRLNHFGDIDNVSAIGFVDLLQTFESSPDSLDLKGKLVIVANIAPGIPTLKPTPLATVLPASLIHATVAENLIQQNFLRELPVLVNWILIVLLVISAWFVSRASRDISKSVVSGGTILIYWIVAMAIFGKANLILPLFYPALAYVASMAYAGLVRTRQRRAHQISIKMLMEEQIVAREAKLELAKAKLSEVQDNLKHESTLSEQARKLVEEKENTILELEKQISDLQTYVIPQEPIPRTTFAEIICSTGSNMTHVLELVTRVASDNIPVLILGDTGTGKEMIARAIHQTSKRRDDPFVAINCGALPETLLESELFGHEKGSFTGAQSRRRGRFELADGGTLFLDEITETTPAFQARLLRVLQEGTFERLGSEQTIKVDVRLIAATNKDLQAEVNKDRFRADLFYRLNGFPITLPPLRDRRDDIPLLAVHFLKKHGYHPVSAFSDNAMTLLQGYEWQGNVRELENVVRRAAILAQSEGRDMIQLSDLPNEMTTSDGSGTMRVAYKSIEDQIVDMLRALKFSRSAISQTAKALGNRDRGTITEYFRGICFKALVDAGYDVDVAAKAIASSTDDQTIERVRAKINEYLNNLYPLPDVSDSTQKAMEKLPSQYKGLPKKYHTFLQQVIEHILKSH